MDNDAVKNAVINVMKSLPPEMREDTAQIFKIVAKHIPKLVELGPSVLPQLMPHIQALGMEFVMGMSNLDGLTTAMDAAFASVGLALPEMPNETPRSATR